MYTYGPSTGSLKSEPVVMDMNEKRNSDRRMKKEINST